MLMGETALADVGGDHGVDVTGNVDPLDAAETPLMIFRNLIAHGLPGLHAI